jgi:hypothetical protein
MLSDWLHFAQPPSWRITTCRMLVTAYAIYLQLTFIYGDRQFHPQREITPCHGDRDALIMVLYTCPQCSIPILKIYYMVTKR